MIQPRISIIIYIFFMLIMGVNGLIFSQGSGSPNVPLIVNVNSYPATGYNDCWGYTAPDGREYALLGVKDGTSIVDITDAPAVTEIAFIPSTFSTWKDIKTYQHYAYVVNEAGGGMQIIDLSNLPNSAALIATYNGFDTSHNIYIDIPAAMLYAEGSSSQPVRAISLADPLSPTQISSFGIECHDVYVQNGIAYVSEGGSGSYGIYDVSNPNSPSLLQRINVPAAGYAHNAWASEDGSYLMTTEETSGKTIKLWDISDLNNIGITDEVLGPSGLAHNAHIKGSYSYVSHYADGLRIYDISDPYNVFEAGYYDTYTPPGGGFEGAWGAYPFFASGKVLISDQSSGLYVVFFEGAALGQPLDPNPPANVTAYSDYTTPTSIALSWDDPTNFFNGDTLLPSQFTIEIERDGAPIASVNGGTGQYNDAGLNDGQLYEYNLYAKVMATDSTSSVESVFWYAGGSPVPAAPGNLSCTTTPVNATLTWADPTTQEDSTPLDDLDHLNVYRDDSLIAAVSPGTETYTDTPPPGFVYTYTVTAVDNENPPNESAPSNTADCFVGNTPGFLVWVGPDVLGQSADSGDSLFAAIAANGESVFLTNDLFEFGADLSIYQGIFVVLGIFSNNHILGASEPEAAALETYLSNGGNLYLEGGDCFYYDPQFSGGYDINPWFSCNPLGDGDGDVFGLLGVNNLSAFAFSYNGENNWMDELSPVNSVAIWQNSQNSDIHGLFNPSYGNGGKAIGVVPSFGGMVNSSAPLNAGIRTVPKQFPGNSSAAGSKSRGVKSEERGVRSAQMPGFFAANQHQAFRDFDRKGRETFVKKAAWYPERKTRISPENPLYKITPNGLQILANNKVDLMAAYLDLWGYSGQPQIGVNPTSVNFDTVAVNQQASQTLYVLNTGTNTLEISDIVSTHAYFSADPLQFSVAAGDSQAVTVTFAPAVAGLHSGSLKIATNVPLLDTLQVNVSGYGDPGVGIDDQETLPEQFAVSPNYPNPFNPSTTIRYQLPQPAEVSLAIYNILGQQVRTLVNGRLETGYHQAVWDGRNDAGVPAGSGVYLYIFQAGEFKQVRKMILMK